MTYSLHRMTTGVLLNDWVLYTTDTLADVVATGSSAYVTDAGPDAGGHNPGRGMALGDRVYVVVCTALPDSGSAPADATAAASCFVKSIAADGKGTLAYVAVATPSP
jgi:hypothetical protein